MKSLHILYDLLDAYERDETDESLFARSMVPEEIPQLAAWINSLPEAERTLLRQRIEQMRRGLELRRQRLSNELLRIQEEIITHQRATQAHIGYLNVSAMGTPPRH